MSCIARFDPDGPLTSNNDWLLTLTLARELSDGTEEAIDLTGASVSAVIRSGSDVSRGAVVLAEKALTIVDAEAGEATLAVTHIENGPTSDAAAWKGQYVMDVRIEFADDTVETCGPLEFDVRRPIT